MVTILAPGRGVAKPRRVDLCLLELWLVRRVQTLRGCCFSYPRPHFLETHLFACEIV